MSMPSPTDARRNWYAMLATTTRNLRFWRTRYLELAGEIEHDAAAPVEMPSTVTLATRSVVVGPFILDEPLEIRSARVVDDDQLGPQLVIEWEAAKSS